MRDYKELLDQSKKQLEIVDTSLDKLLIFEETKDFSSLINETYHLVKVSEQFTEMTRLLPIFTGARNAFDTTKEIITDSLDIKIQEEKYGWSFHLPALLPKKEKSRASFIRTAIVSACERFSNQHTVQLMKDDIVLVFQHNYSSKEREWRDHDNIEINVVVDAIAMHFLEDDSSKKCSHFYFSSLADTDSTDIFVVKKELFEKFLKDKAFI